MTNSTLQQIHDITQRVDSNKHREYVLFLDATAEAALLDPLTDVQTVGGTVVGRVISDGVRGVDYLFGVRVIWGATKLRLWHVTDFADVLSPDEVHAIAGTIERAGGVTGISSSIYVRYWPAREALKSMGLLKCV